MEVKTILSIIYLKRSIVNCFKLKDPGFCSNLYNITTSWTWDNNLLIKWSSSSPLCLYNKAGPELAKSWHVREDWRKTNGSFIISRQFLLKTLAAHFLTITTTNRHKQSANSLIIPQRRGRLIKQNTREKYIWQYMIVLLLCKNILHSTVYTIYMEHF